jgi:type IV pilus assembly protein PilO
LGTVVEREFYAELPIKMTVRGDYHGFGSFASGVAALPRIVTLDDFTITPVANRFLQMSISAKTYRYAAGSAGKKAAAPKRGRR